MYQIVRQLGGRAVSRTGNGRSRQAEVIVLYVEGVSLASPGLPGIAGKPWVTRPKQREP